MKITVKYILSGSFACLICLLLLTGCASTTASDVPQAPEETPKDVKITEFILGPRDTIEILVYRQDDLKRTIQIDPSGIISYPLIGDIQAGGLSIFQLRDKLKDGLSKYLVNPQVSVGVTSVKSQKVIVLGEVKTPGLFSLESPMSALEAMSKAGGFTIDAKLKTILLIRGGLKNPELVTLNLESALKEGDFAQNAYLQNGDIIYVPATTIANVSRFFDYLSRIIAPITSMESGYFTGQQIEGSRGSAAVGR
ncbi:MAG: polysaccharide export protein [Nitrospirae bacterium]|nr:polysaccharide export protein [Nitrospirota bacterium]MBI3378229.1 polysaccharide export protein [Nitrospirota bacterium]